ncbi:uncharacterized protein LOC110423743 [Herrania umbratica]|uniref:Uncharacterized protein LOC110423743 n=1 Tax=Herrania umbratica TaxID=108875 RepID=A0A6J1B381_9ROSI|nr:uncharacterized protein LOC110423743 [Herrania umbratica]
MAILNRLPTRDRLLSWGISVRSECALCNQDLETRYHLFLSCDHSKHIWKRVLQTCAIQRDVAYWNGDLHWAVHRLREKALISVILHRAWSAFVYYFWRERYNRVNVQAASLGSKVHKLITDAMCLYG